MFAASIYYYREQFCRTTGRLAAAALRAGEPQWRSSSDSRRQVLLRVRQGSFSLADVIPGSGVFGIRQDGLFCLESCLSDFTSARHRLESARYQCHGIVAHHISWQRHAQQVRRSTSNKHELTRLPKSPGLIRAVCRPRPVA